MGESTSHIEVRRALPSEADAISRVLHEAFVEFESSYIHEAYAATTPGTEQVANRFAEGPLWVAVQDGTIVGTVSAVPKGDALYVRSMAVLSDARGLGIGVLLLAEVESYALAHGHKTLFLSTTPFLTGAIRLYERAGFQRTDDGPHDLFGTPLFTMVKTLGPG